MNEPLVIDAETVARTLERHGYERMANWCRGVGNTMKRQALSIELEQAEHRKTLERLHKHEPPPAPYEDLSRWTGD